MVPTVRLTLRIGRLERHRLGVVEGRSARLDQLVVEGPVEAVVLGR